MHKDLNDWLNDLNNNLHQSLIVTVSMALTLSLSRIDVQCTHDTFGDARCGDNLKQLRRTAPMFGEFHISVPLFH